MSICLRRALFGLVWVWAAATSGCRGDTAGTPPPDNGGSAGDASDATQRGAGVVGGGQTGDTDTTAPPIAAPPIAAGGDGQGSSSARSAPTSGGATDQIMAVDVGNPKDTGPGKTGKLKLNIADAAIADAAQAFLIRPVAIELVASDPAGRVRIDLPEAPVDLLQYQGGAKYVLFTGDVPAGRYEQVRIVLDQEAPATLVLDGGSAAAVLVPSLAAATTGVVDAAAEKGLYGGVALDIAAGATSDVTMHVDLRQQLQAVASSLPAGWDVFDAGAAYWLMPASTTFLSDSVGTLTGLGLPLEALVACVYAVDPSTPLDRLGVPLLTGADASSSCAHATGSALVHDLTFTVAFLPPGTYGVRLFITDTAYVDLPGLANVLAGAVSSL